MDDTVAPPRAKITGLYVNSALAKSEAVTNGYDEAILLSHDGHVSEGSAENIFLVRRGVLYTPDPSQNVLEGVTRRAIVANCTRPKRCSSRERPSELPTLRRSIAARSRTARWARLPSC